MLAIVPHFPRCAVCERPLLRGALCRVHARVADLREDVMEGARSDWPAHERDSRGYPMPVNHQVMMATHPQQLGQERVGWQREAEALLALYRVRLWDGPERDSEEGRKLS